KDPAKLATLVAAASGLAETPGVAAAARVGATATAGGGDIAGGGAGATAPVQPDVVAGKVGQLETLHIAQARELRLALPETLREFVESTGRARALVLALLLSRDDAVRERQFVLHARGTTGEELAVIRATLPVAASLEPMLRLP